MRYALLSRYADLKRRYNALPLSLKLTLANTAVMLAIAGAALVGVREGLRVMLEKELEVALHDEVYEIAVNAHRSYTDPDKIFEDMARTSAGHIRHGWFLQLFDRDGRNAVWSSANTPGELNALPIGDPDPDDIRHVASYELASFHLHKPGLPEYWIRLGTSTTFIDEAVNNVTRIMLPVLGVLLLLAPLGGYFLAGRATAPLKRIIAITETFHPNRLGDRLIIRGSGDELDRLSETINRFLDEIAEHLVRNRTFVADAAHELRSPLAAIESAIDVSLRIPRSEEEYQDLLATVQEECRQLSVLVNQLLLLAESDAGRLELQQTEVALDIVVRLSADMFSGIAEENQLRFQTHIDPDILVLGEESRLRRVVNNLIDNAIKFTRPGDTIRVSLRTAPDRQTVSLTVADTGIGIPRHCLHRLFDRFFQVDSSRAHDTVRHGTGLGLSICAAIVKAYRGSIRVQSEVGKGTTFVVTFPLLDPAGRRAEQERLEEEKRLIM